MSFTIRKATRQNVKPLVGVYGESGTGKTFSALLMARGIVGPTGKIIMGDSESGRGSLYADVIPGGYDTLDLESPFSPMRYIEMIDAIEKAGAEIGIIDSASHEWEGIGGVTDSAASISQARAAKYNKDWDGNVQFGDWKEPKMSHQKFMLRMMQSSIPWIVCLRAKYKSRQVKGTQEMADAGIIQKKDIGRSVIVKDSHTSPIQAEDFIFEMTCHFEVLQDHTIHLTKHSHPSLKECFPEDFKEPVSIKHGEAIAAWAAGGGAKPRPQTAAPTGTTQPARKLSERAQAGKDLWDMVRSRFDDVGAFESYLFSESKLNDGESLVTLPLDRIKTITEFMKS